MNNLTSPFIDSIKDCKQTMRKLRKKIYKHSISTKPKVRKAKDSTEEIIEIFRVRKIPEFVTETLKKRRNFDLSSIKNIAINTLLTLQEIQCRTNQQQHQANQLYEHHKQRMNDLRIRTQQSKTEKSLGLNLHGMGIYSTTEEQGLFSSEENPCLQSNEMDEQYCYQNFSEHSKEQIFADNYLQLNNMESSLNSELALFNF